jgi:3-oxoacyl-[acyl-carrier protein] reductase
MRQVVVTGGGTGIGYAIAETFAHQGDQVTITGRRAPVLRSAAENLHASPVAFDAADPAAIGAALDELPEKVDVLVNNAGRLADLSRPADQNGDLASVAAAWTADLQANLMPAVLVTTALQPRLADNARIVSIGSIASRGTGSGPYGAAKAALESWTADLASEVGSRGITANVVSPGLVVETELFRGLLTDEAITTRAAATRNGRAGTPADVAATVRFLASPQAGHLTGQVIHVNGGAYLGR